MERVYSAVFNSNFLGPDGKLLTTREEVAEERLPSHLYSAAAPYQSQDVSREHLLNGYIRDGERSLDYQEGRKSPDSAHRKVKELLLDETARINDYEDALQPSREDSPTLKLLDSDSSEVSAESKISGRSPIEQEKEGGGVAQAVLAKRPYKRNLRQLLNELTIAAYYGGRGGASYP